MAHQGPGPTDPRKVVLDKVELERRLEMSRRARRLYERDWMLNLAYLSNEQYVDYVLDTGRLVDRDIPDDQTATVFNECFRITRTERAKIMRSSPKPRALPAKDNEKDIMTARILDAYFAQLMWEWNFESRFRNASFWIVATGNVFFNWYWTNGPDGEPDTGGNHMDIVSPFEMFVDPYPKRMDECKWMIQAKFMDLETAWESYADIAGSHPEHLVQSEPEQYSRHEQRVYTDLGMGGMGGPPLEGCTVYTYYEPPRPSRPLGRYVIFTQSGIVFDSEYPYAHGLMPFTHAGHIERSSSKYYASLLDYERGPQDELNRAESQMIENRNLSQGKWIIPAEVELDQLPNAQARQILKITGGPPGTLPTWETPNTLPSWVTGEPDRIRQTMNNIANQHEISQGGVPGRVESGQAIQLLQETDDSVMKDTIHSLQEALARGFWISSALFVQYGKPEMIVQTYDDHGLVEVKRLLKDNIDLTFRVRVNIASSLPANIAGKWDRVLNLTQYAIVTPQEARKLLDLTIDEPSLDFTLKDRKDAKRENWKFLDTKVFYDEETGAFDIPPEEVMIPIPEEDHQVHIFEHEDFMKGEEFKKAHPWNQTYMRLHVGEHYKLRISRAEQEVMYQQVLSGATLAPPQGEEAPPEGEPVGGPPQQPDTQGPPEVAV